MSSSGCILKCRVAGSIFRCHLVVYLEVSCSGVIFRCIIVSIQKCRVAGVF